MTGRLLAIDLDGTLLRTDGSIHPRDVEAVQIARRAGVVVTLATGRLATGTVPTAQTLGLDAPLVCADGGLMVCARTGRRLEQRALALGLTESVIEQYAAHRLVPFVLLHDSVHCDERGRAHAEYISIWTRHVTIHPRLADASVWRRDGDIALAVGLGDKDQVELAMSALQTAHGDLLETLCFRASRTANHWALLARAPGCSKGAALAKLAEQLEIAQAQTAVVGDWFNDVSMFVWAGRSFAMGQAPEMVRQHATDVLIATSATGGGVAEAIERWLDSASFGRG